MPTPFDDLVAKRQSIRSFSQQPVGPGDLMAICEAARAAPSACNSQTWRFIGVTNTRTIRQIAEEAMRPVIPNRWVAQAPLIIVGCSQLDIIANRIGSRISGIEYYRIDLGIAMEHMVLKATELGLGTCWIGWFSEDKVKTILHIPKRVKVSAMLAVGYSTETRPKSRSRKPMEQILFSEKWGTPFTRDG